MAKLPPMIESNASLPLWIQYAWAISAFVVLIAGALWMVFVMWPYLRDTREKMKESLELGRKSAEILMTVQKDLDPIIKDAGEVVHKVREASDAISGLIEKQKIDKVKQDAEAFVAGLANKALSFLFNGTKKGEIEVKPGDETKRYEKVGAAGSYDKGDKGEV